MKKILVVLVFVELVVIVMQCFSYIGLQRVAQTSGIMNEASETASDKNLVRLSKITVDSLYLTEYNAYLIEEIKASMRLEPGVLTLYATAKKEQPNQITILEIYTDQEAYKSHIQTPHFQKYKQGTLKMVQELELIDCNPLIPGLKIK